MMTVPPLLVEAGRAFNDALTAQESRLKSRAAKAKWTDTFRQHISEMNKLAGLAHYATHPETRELRRTIMNALWADDSFRERMMEHWNDPKVREWLSKNSKAYWAKPGVRQHRSKAMKGLWAKPEYKKRVGASIKKGWAKPGYKERMSAIQKERWNDLTRELQSEITTAVLADPILRKRMSDSQKQTRKNRPELMQNLAEFNKARFAKPGERRKQSKRMKAHMRDPGNRESRSIGMKAHMSKPEVRKHRSDTMRAHMADPAIRKHRSDTMKAYWAKRNLLAKAA